jgi:methylated-DNA-[protein]-cysteine S-methyltransferase
MNILAETFTNRWFSATFHWRDGLLTSIDLDAKIKPATSPQSPHGVKLARIIAEYAQLEADIWPELPLDTSRLTPFSMHVLKTLQLHTPRGCRTTYGRLAALCGSPRAARAVGGAMARNPWPLLYPCHRVLTGSMGLGGFSCGVALKRTLLTLEKGALAE